jgi:glutamate 5-kinase
VNYSSQDAERIKGRKTSEIESILGYKYSDEVVHRDNLVLLAG